MRACILAVIICALLPAAFAQAGTIRPTGPGYHVVGPTAALLRSSDGGGWHRLGPMAALLRLFDGGGFHYLGPKAAVARHFGPGYHVVGPTAALSRRPGDRVARRGSAE